MRRAHWIGGLAMALLAVAALAIAATTGSGADGPADGSAQGRFGASSHRAASLAGRCRSYRVRSRASAAREGAGRRDSDARHGFAGLRLCRRGADSAAAGPTVASSAAQPVSGATPPATPPAAPPPPGGGATTTKPLVIGLNAQTGGWGPDIAHEQARAAETGVRWLREELTWHVIEPADDRWSWDLADRVIGAAARQGLTILPLLLGTPSWAGASWNTLPTEPGEFAEYAAHVADRYGPHGSFWRANADLPRRPVTALEVWNEPYLNGFSAAGIDPARYARLVRSTALAVRAADADVAVLAAAETRDDAGGDWIARMFAAVSDLTRYVDGVAVHPYTRAHSPDEYTPPHTRYAWRRIDEIRADLLRRGIDVPLWITELGWSTCPAGAADDCVSEQQQAEYLDRAIVLSNARPWVTALFVYSYRAWEQDAKNREHFFGIVHADGSPKPAWEVLRRAVQAAPTARARGG